MKTRVFLGSVLYRTIGRVLPDSSNSDFARKVRRVICQLIFGKLEANVNINKNAHFSENISIGDYSSIGKECVLQGIIYIGKHVAFSFRCREVIVY